MNKLSTAALGLAVALLPVLGVGVAAAETDLSCDDAKAAVVKAQDRFDSAAAVERTTEDAALNAAKQALKAARELPNTTDVEKQVRKDAIDLANLAIERAENDLASDSKKLARLRVDLQVAVTAQEQACAEPTTTPPTPTPEPTTPAPTTTSEFPVDLDCSDLSDQEAQKVLDADKSDPHNLDSDEDGLACDEVDNPVNDTVVVPSGGVNTGAGPA